MYNNNDEMYEVNDYDEDIQTRQALIEEVKVLQETLKDNVDMRIISNLKRSWKQIQYWESAYEDKMSEEFESLIDVFYEKRREGYEANKATKLKLIEEAKQFSISDDWNNATNQMNDLMTQWKATESAGRDNDDELWNDFNAARQVFFDRKHKNWEDRKLRFENARQVKQDLIAQATAIFNSEDWQKTSEQFKQLMNQWKAVGSAGREHEDALWKEFNDCRQKFYDRRSAHYEALDEQHAQKYEAKMKLVEQAREIVESEEYTKNNTEKMKILSNEWKKIGFCGKDKEDQIWNKFRSFMDAYFNGLRLFNDQKHEQWKQNLLDARSRKQDQIQNQKRQIHRMQEDIIGLLGERAINETLQDIEDKKVYIAELESELADIDKVLESK